MILPRSISELESTATLHLGKTADWVAIAPGAVWVGSTGPFAVHRIDTKTNQRVATVKLPGEPCAGLATGFGSLWVPLCGRTPRLAKVDLESNRLLHVFKIGLGRRQLLAQGVELPFRIRLPAGLVYIVPVES